MELSRSRVFGRAGTPAWRDWGGETAYGERTLAAVVDLATSVTDSGVAGTFGNSRPGRVEVAGVLRGAVSDRVVCRVGRGGVRLLAGTGRSQVRELVAAPALVDAPLAASRLVAMLRGLAAAEDVVVALVRSAVLMVLRLLRAVDWLIATPPAPGSRFGRLPAGLKTVTVFRSAS